ncbi:helix-turn-helix domain-containing protein [Pseudonocardia spinosispora]|uniref:helix-turn-helix domain-containing protein n=1 Tax=Pseudonocardia spinosispora TaxID=103441 RepID=UPI000409DF7E|nr:helix-turn-helix transcriptional regulator [Pseudonocardia spinosispora]
MPDRSGGRDELSRRLRELRDAAGLRQVDATGESGISQPTIARFETGRQIPRPDQVDKLCATYRASDIDRDELMAMAEDLRAGNRRVVLRREPGAAQSQIARIRATSALVRTFSPSGIPGLLQTPAYCRAVFGEGLTDRAAEDGIAARIAGQAILDDRESGRRFELVMSEGSLGWSVLPPTDMGEQIDHIAAATYLPNARVGIIPWGVTASVLPLHSWTIFDERAVMAGSTTGVALLTERADVDRYVELTEQLERLAVFGAEARAILGLVADRYRRMAEEGR